LNALICIKIKGKEKTNHLQKRKKQRKEANQEDQEMSFLDHLETLRWHLVRSIGVILGFTILAFINKTVVFDLIVLGPSRLDFWTYEQLCNLSHFLVLGNNLCFEEMGFKLSNIHMAGQFTQHIFVSVAFGIILGFPYLVYELWRFLKPALDRSERKYARGMIFFSSLLFFLGVLFGYYLLTPMSVQFLGSYRVSDTVQNAITLRSYVSTVASVTFAAAIIFEMPVVVYFLSKMGLITPRDMRYYRKHALIVVLLIAAVLTPPDVTSQLLLCLPFLILYEISISLSAIVSKKAAP